MYRERNKNVKQFKTHKFTESEITRIANSVSELRQAAPVNIRNSRNMSFRSINKNSNAWWTRNPSASNSLSKIETTLISPLSQREKQQIIGSFILVRNVPSIVTKGVSGRSYIQNQTLHINYETHPRLGEAFKQIIYYVDTPRYSNGRVANVGNRGELLLRASNGNTQRLAPEKGHAVYFNPTTVFHEVLQQSNSNQNVNVDRKMIIMFLYKSPTTTREISEQIRTYPRSNFPSLVRSLAGYIPRPTRARQTPNSLVRRIRRIAVSNSPRLSGKIRKRTNNSNNNQRPAKRRM